MSPLAEFNAYMGAILPVWIWSFLQIGLGGLVMIGTFAQRNGSDRFKSSNIHCTPDAITTRMGQVGLAILGTAAFAIVVDGVVVRDAPPRIFLIILFFGYFMIQVRVIYQALVGIWYHRIPMAL